jgi:hypothetical protein
VAGGVPRAYRCVRHDDWGMSITREVVVSLRCVLIMVGVRGLFMGR